MLSHHVVWEVCVTISKERSSFHLQGGTYTIRRMVGGYEHVGGRWCFHLQCRIFTCCSLEYGYTHFRGTYCHKLQSRNFKPYSLVGGYQYFGGTCCFSNDITMCFSRWLVCITANFSLQLQDLTCTILPSRIYVLTNVSVSSRALPTTYQNTLCHYTEDYSTKLPKLNLGHKWTPQFL